MFQSRVMCNGVSVALGRYETKERASIARRLAKLWLKKGYPIEEVEPKLQEPEKTKRSNQYHRLIAMDYMLIRVNADLTVSFGWQFYHNRKYYCNFGYSELAISVKACNNKRRLLGITEDSK